MKQRIENYLLKHLFKAVTLTDIVGNDIKTGALLIDGKPLKDDEIKQLKAEIKALEGFRIWTLITETTKHHAEDTIFNKSKNIDDIHFGKAMLYNLSLQISIVKAIKDKVLQQKS